MSYYQTGSLADTDGLMNTIHNLLTSSGVDFLHLNTSSAKPQNWFVSTNGPGVTRETIYRFNGTPSDPTRFYVSFCRYTDSDPVGTDSIRMMPFGGIKNFDNPVSISLIKRFPNNVVEVTCSSAHNLDVGDRFIVNGVNDPSFNLLWGPQSISDNSVTSQDCVVSSVSNTASFSYRTVLSNFGATGSGGNVVGIYTLGSTRQAHDLNTRASGVNIPLPGTGSCGAYLYYDNYCINGVITQGGFFMVFYVGETQRDHIPSDFRGRAFITSSIGPGIVTASLDRQTANINTGQYVCFAHPSGSQGTGSCERVQVINKLNLSQIVVSLSGTYTSGTLVGEDVCPAVVIGAGTSQGSTQQLVSRTTRFIYSLLGSGSANRGDLQTMTPVVDTGLTEANIDPDSLGYYQGKEIFLQRSTVPEGSRGKLRGFVAFPLGSQNDQDIMRCGTGSVVNDFKVFPSLSVDGTYILGIGPGAS